jgi:hypothetical protein
LVACLADPSGRSLDRPTVNRGAHPAPLAGLDSPDSVSRTLQIIPLSQISPDLRHAVIAAEGGPLLPAPWVRLARDPNRCRTRFGSRSHSRSFNHYAATGTERIFRNGPLIPPPGSRVHTGTGGRIRPRQAVHSKDLPPCGRMGSWYLWRRVGMSLLRRNRCPERRSGTAGAVRCDSAAPLKRQPKRMNNYSVVIFERMPQMGW